MAVALFGSISTHPREKSDWVFASSGATLDSSNLLQLNWDTTTYNLATPEGKERLLVAAYQMVHMLEAAVSRNSSTLV